MIKWTEIEEYRPMIFMLISSLAFTLMNVIVKYFDHIGPYQLVFFRSSGSFILCIIYLSINGIPLLGNRKKWLIARAIVGTISLTLFFVALKYIPMGSAVTLRYLSPIFASILAFLFLKEKISMRQWIFFLLAAIGVAMLKGFDLRISFMGLMIILGSAFFSGLVYFVISKIGKSEHPIVIVGYFMFIASSFGLVTSFQNWYWPSNVEWFLIGALGILGFFGQLFMTMAIRLDQLSKVVPFKYTEAIFTIIIGWVYFGEGFELLAIFGMLLIILAMLGNVFLKSKSKPVANLNSN